MNTTDSILKALEEISRSKAAIDPIQWITAAQKLTLLMGEEVEKLHSMEQSVSQLQVNLIEEGKSAAEAKLRVEATETYKEAKTQKAKIMRIEETVRLAKLRGRISEEKFKRQ